MEWIRLITIVLAIITTIQLSVFCYKYHQPGIIAPITWLINIIAYDVFKAIVGNSLDYYMVSVIWVNVIFVHGIIMLLIAGYLWKDYKEWNPRLF